MYISIYICFYNYIQVHVHIYIYSRHGPRDASGGWEALHHRCWSGAVASQYRKGARARAATCTPSLATNSWRVEYLA